MHVVLYQRNEIIGEHSGIWGVRVWKVGWGGVLVVWNAITHVH